MKNSPNINELSVLQSCIPKGIRKDRVAKTLSYPYPKGADCSNGLAFIRSLFLAYLSRRFFL